MQVDAMSTPIEAQFDPAMNQAFAAHALADSGFVQQIHCALFQDARTNAILDMFASLGLDDDRLNARKMQELGQDKSGWSGSDDRNLGTMAFAHVIDLQCGARTRACRIETRLDACLESLSHPNKRRDDSRRRRPRARATSMVNLS